MATKINLPTTGRIEVVHTLPAGIDHHIKSRPVPSPIPYDGPAKRVSLFTHDGTRPLTPHDFAGRPNGPIVNKLSAASNSPDGIITVPRGTVVKTQGSALGHLVRGLFGNTE